MRNRSINKPTMNRSRRKECGAFFTPHWIAADMIRTHSIHHKWAEGASVLDPTAGTGNLLESLIRCCLEDGIPVTRDMIDRLKGYEREAEFTLDFGVRIREIHGIDHASSCLECRDFLDVPPADFDLILGNPPWLNFTDVREEEKEELKKAFIRYGLAGGSRNILLGSARIDLAALMIQKAMEDHLKSGGEAFFFIPLSLILNEGAHNRFRRGNLAEGYFSFREIRDFGEFRVFEEVSTRCGFISLQKHQASPAGTEKPLPAEVLPYYSLKSDRSWRKETARPVGPAGSAYRVTDVSGDITMPVPLITIEKSSRPRQGINTGGRNTLFIFDSCEDAGEAGGERVCRLANRQFSALLPRDLIFPLLNREQFKGQSHPARYIFLPYNSSSGKPLTPGELEKYPSARRYLEDHRESLESRKGTLIGSSISRGIYWSLLGVGPYSFSPWKVVWEAYGRNEFLPRLFGTASLNAGKPKSEKPWIVNQALQASCSFTDKAEAERVLEALLNPEIGRILKQQKMEGTCNWAQPGRIRHFLREA